MLSLAVIKFEIILKNQGNRKLFRVGVFKKEKNDRIEQNRSKQF
jgi:hypothetical protein